MPRMDGMEVARFPAGSDDITLNTNITTKLEVLSENINNLGHTNEEVLDEIGRIRRANELIVGQDIEESD